MVLTSPADLLCAVPYLVGFHPAESLVVTGFTGRPPDGRLRLTTRWDLPLVPGALDLVVPLLAREGVTQVMIAGFGPGALVTPAMDAVVPMLREAGVDVVEALRATGVFRIMQPRRWGGLEADFTTFMEVSEEIGRGDGSAAWVTALMNVCCWMVGLFPEQAQRDVWGAVLGAALDGEQHGDHSASRLPSRRVTPPRPAATPPPGNRRPAGSRR